MRDAADPLTDPAPEELALADPPLVRVVAQVRFPSIMAVQRAEFVAPMQEAVRAEYPVLRQEMLRTWLADVGEEAEGASQARTEIVWRFSDPDADWQLSLASHFLALETRRYPGRSEFLARLRRAVGALGEHVRPRTVDRLGLRYVDRITGERFEQLPVLIRPELRGLASTAPGRWIEHALSETHFVTPEANLYARWGTLAPDQTIDPSIEPVPERSWILDLDAFSATPAPFDVEACLAASEAFARRVYAFFRWAVTEEFLRLYGARR